MNTYDYIAAVEVETAPYENIAAFGFRLAQFAQQHPDVNFVWGEADYAEDLDEDEHDNPPAADDIKVFEKDINRAVFIIRFRTEADRDLYFGHVEDDEDEEVLDPRTETLVRLGLISLH